MSYTPKYAEMHYKINLWAEKRPDVGHDYSYMWHYIMKANPDEKELNLMREYISSQYTNNQNVNAHHLELLELIKQKKRNFLLKIWTED